VKCQPDTRDWWANDQPQFSSDPASPDYGKCIGYTNVPDDVLCGGSYKYSERLCHCDALRPTDDVRPFGIGHSQGSLTTEEFELFRWIVPSGATGVMTHFWITAMNDYLANCVIRYYIDGEANASIAFQPGLASGVGWNDKQVWGTKWIGKGAADGSWFNNFKIPFQKSVSVTWQVTQGSFTNIFFIVRGAPNHPITIAGVDVPLKSRLNLAAQTKTLQPLEFYDMVNVPSGTHGLHFFSTLAVESGNMNFLEGCWHFYSPSTQPWPGMLLATGCEDYYDSGWYFDGGQFHMPVSGYTHYAEVNGGVQWSAYRLHDVDPLQFTDGYRIQWRNGDAADPKTGFKCKIQNGGNVVGSPTASNVTSYAWYYT